MPRGNDAPEAASDLADKFGSGAGNAEELINANNARHSKELTTLNLLSIDDEATADLDIGSLSGPDGEPVLAAAVRSGGRVRGTVVVYEDDAGRLHKDVQDFDDGSQRARSKSAERTQKQNVRSQSSEPAKADK